MKINRLIDQLESEWDVEGFLGRLRQGQFTPVEGEVFLNLLRGIQIGDEDQVPKRLLSLLWYIPSFLAWQGERVEEKDGDRVAYDRFVNAVHSALEDTLGIP